MAKKTIPLHSYRETSHVFHWAKKRHYQLWFSGQTKTRHRRTEHVLNHLVKRGELTEIWYEGTKNYTDKRPTAEIVHGLACTECLVRFYLSDREGTVIPERYFKGFGSVPEWGILYPKGTLLLFEFSTKNNFLFSGKMRGKLSSYERNLWKIEKKFSARAIVVFVLDVPLSAVERFVGAVAGAPHEGGHPLTPVYFTDHESFLKVPIGSQLSAPIFFWGADGKKYSLNV